MPEKAMVGAWAEWAPPAERAGPSMPWRETMVARGLYCRLNLPLSRVDDNRCGEVVAGEAGSGT
jgi:hypothetical protein